MPGFDGTGPMGMGPMTGGGQGMCNPYGRPTARMGSRQGFVGGRGRGYRNMYWATGMPGWMRSGPSGPWGYPFAAPSTKEDEVRFLKEQAAVLKEELNAIDSQLRDLESEGKRPE